MLNIIFRPKSKDLVGHGQAMGLYERLMAYKQQENITDDAHAMHMVFTDAALWRKYKQKLGKIYEKNLNNNLNA